MLRLRRSCTAAGLRIQCHAALCDSRAVSPGNAGYRFSRRLQIARGILAAAATCPLSYSSISQSAVTSGQRRMEQFCILPGGTVPSFSCIRSKCVEFHGNERREEISRTISNLAQGFDNYCSKIAPLLLTDRALMERNHKERWRSDHRADGVVSGCES